MTNQEREFEIMQDKLKDQVQVLESIRTRRMFVITIQLILFITLTMIWEDPGHRIAMFIGTLFSTYKGIKGLYNTTWEELDWTNLEYIFNVGNLKREDYYSGLIRNSSNRILINGEHLDEKRDDLKRYIGLTTSLLILYVIYPIVLRLLG